MEKYNTAGQAIDENMAHVHCMLDIYGCKHILRICNTNCFSTAKMVEKYNTAGQAIDENMAHVHCMLDIYGCKHILRICNTNCFLLQQWWKNATQYYVIRTFPVLFTVTLTKPIRNNYPSHNY